VQVAKKILTVLLSIFLWILILSVAIFIIFTLSKKQNDGIPDLFGYSPLVVLTDSMKGNSEQNFVKGDLIVIGPTDYKKLKVKDIITFWDIIDGKKAANTHRIVSINNSGSTIQFVTKGDNNPNNDETMRSPADIIGIYHFKIKGAGNIINFLSSKNGFFFCLVLPLVFFFIWRLIKLILVILEYNRIKSLPNKPLEEPENDNKKDI
jgi:signal peptidase